MNENESGHNNLLDTTDCLEAVGVFKGWKNLLFIIILLCLLLTQACFWLVDIGWVPIPSDTSLALGQEGRIRIPEGVDGLENSNLQVESPDPNQLIIETNLTIEPNTPVGVNAITAEQQQSSSTTESAKDFFLKITFDRLVWVLNLLNAILILAAILFCLTMLFSLKVSMIGRLGGINHITRAFFLSLFLLILLVPWQKFFGDTVVGAVFTPRELIRAASLKAGVLFETVLYYLRFTGYSVLILLLLILAQIRSCRWAGAILRRLEII